MFFSSLQKILLSLLKGMSKILNITSIKKECFNKNILSKILDNIYPQFCLNCEKKIAKSYLCDTCSSFLKISNQKNSKNLAVFEDYGPIIALIREIKRTNNIKLQKVIADFFIYRFFDLNWHEICFDHIIFYKMEKWHVFMKKLKKQIKVPIIRNRFWLFCKIKIYKIKIYKIKIFKKKNLINKKILLVFIDKEEIKRENLSFLIKENNVYILSLI